jgi:xanthine/CO dehydrogenase XdhC/CoxF family maturation factor
MMNDALWHAQVWQQAGDAVALATVVDTWGSAPCPVGSVMAISASGRLEGSVSGGCVEAAVREAALEVMEAQGPRVLDFSVSDDNAWSVGLPCGGRIRVLVEALRD